MNHSDVIIVGAGPSGSTLASLLAQEGHKVTLFEREKFPRPRIGESLLPHSLPILKKSGALDRLYEGDFVIKPGATFFSEELGKGHDFLFSQTLNPIYPHAFNVERDRFDEVLLNVARDQGVEILQPCNVERVHIDKDGVNVNGTHHAQMIVWASGIGHSSVRPENYVDNAPGDRVTSVYGYFPADFSQQSVYGNIIINIFHFTGNSRPQWAWCMPLRKDFASVGFVIHDDELKRKISEQGSLTEIGQHLLSCNPHILQFIDRSRQIGSFTLKHNFQRIAKKLAWEREMLLGDAAGFIDPVFSSGVHLGLSGALAASQTISRCLGTGCFAAEEMRDYEDTFREIFWLYYKVVKAFYQRNMVERIFLRVPTFDTPEVQEKLIQFNTILSGDAKSTNALLQTIATSKYDINPLVEEHFARCHMESH